MQTTWPLTPPSLGGPQDQTPITPPAPWPPAPWAGGGNTGTGSPHLPLNPCSKHYSTCLPLNTQLNPADPAQQVPGNGYNWSIPSFCASFTVGLPVACPGISISAASSGSSGEGGGSQSDSGNPFLDLLRMLAGGAEDAAPVTERATAVIQRQVDSAVAKDWAGHEVLDLPANEWTLAKNDRWVQSVIDRKLPVYVGSNTTWPNLWDAVAGRPTVFARELVQFTNAGYTWDGWTLLPPGGG